MGRRNSWKRPRQRYPGCCGTALPITGVDPEHFHAGIAESAAKHTPWACEVGYIGPRTGRERWVRAQQFPRRTADGVPYFAGVIIDITDWKRAEDEARRACQAFAAHLANVPLAVIEWDSAMRVVRWSPQAEKMFGWSADEVRGKHFDEWRFVHEDDAERIRGVGNALSTGAEPRNVIRNRNYHKSGRVLHCEWHNSLLTDDRGAVVSVLSMVRDETAEVEARELVARSKERLKSALAVAGMLVWDFDFGRNEAYYSTDYAKFFGIPGDVQVSDFDRDMLAVHPEDRDWLRRDFEAQVLSGAEFVADFRGPTAGPNGTPRWFQVRARRVPSDGPAPRILGVTTDITSQKLGEVERAALEREVQESRRRESLGVLAGGIAHDLNNILTVILGYAQILHADAAGTDNGQPALVEIERACHRAAELCRQMTAFAGTGRVMTGRLDLNHVIREAAEALAVAARPATLHLDLASPSPEAFADPFQVRQLLLNLVRNAGEAKSTQVHLRTEAVKLSSEALPYGYTPQPQPGRYAVLTVADDGSGMNETTRSAVFDPFFTTKGASRGLGMAAVFGIVRSHRGSIRIDTSPGNGTTVLALLPASPPQKRAIAPQPARASQYAPPARPTRGSAGIALVADDEPNIRELTAVVLEDAGYIVRVAADGQQALELFRGESQAITMAVIDVVMPGMNGSDLVREMRQSRADLPVVLMTGYTARQLPNDITRQPRTVILTKPFRLEDLAKAAHAAVHPA